MAIPPVVAQSQSASQIARQARQLYSTGQMVSAAQAWGAAAEGYGRQGDGLNQAMALSNLSLTQQKLGRWDSAVQAMVGSLEILNAQPDSAEKTKILAATLDIKGFWHREIGKPADALDAWREASKLYEEMGATNKIAQNTLNQAQAMQDLGLYPRACQTILSVLPELDAQNCQALQNVVISSPGEDISTFTENLQGLGNATPTITKVRALRSLGDLLLIFGEPEQARPILETSVALAKNVNSPEEEALTQLSLGNSLRVLANTTEARRSKENFRNQALLAYIETAKLSSSNTKKIQAQLSGIKLQLEAEKWDLAKQAWDFLAIPITELPISRNGVYLQIDFALDLVDLAASINKENQDFGRTLNPFPVLSFQEINNLLTNAANQAQTLDNRRAQAYSIGYLGKLYELEDLGGNLTTAEEYTREALGIIPNTQAADIAYQFFWQLGRIRKARGDIEEAIAAYTNSFDALQSLRGDLLALNREFQFSFRDEVEPVYRQLVDLDLALVEQLEAQAFAKQAGNKQANQVVSDESQDLLRQAQEVIESLQLAELNNFFQEACIEAEPKKIDDLDQNAAVIYPIILEDRLEVLLSLPNDQPIFHQEFDVSRRQLEEIVEEVQSSLQVPGSDFLEQYQQLYNWLVRPFESELANNKEITTLAFVLDGVLQNIPMAILYDGQQYLIEKYALAITPGLQLVDPKPISEIDLRVLSAGLSDVREDFDPHANFTKLPSVEDELKQIQAIGLSDQPLINEEFNRDALREEILSARYPIVHLATHGQFSEDAEDTFILTWDERIDVKQLDRLLQEERFNLRQPIELLVLSACQTAKGDERAALGLSGVAVKAGARSTLSTLWSVEDESTAQLMKEFYQELGQAKDLNINKAQALQKAQLDLLQDKYEGSNGQSKYVHPYYWAPFVLVGNWQ